MTSSPAVIKQTQSRLIRQRRLNICGLYLLPLCTMLVLGIVLVRQFASPPLLAFLPVFGLALWTGMALWQAGKSIEATDVAALIDEKTQSQERLLTLSTVPPALYTSPFVALLQRQVQEKLASFSPQRAFPFLLDRRIFFTSLASALMLLVLFLLPPSAALVPLPNVLLDEAPPEPQQELSASQQQEIAKLTDFARALMQDGKTPQEKTAGAQLLALAEQLKDPTIPPEEKQRIIEETKQRLEIPLPQLLPFELDLFASKGQKGKEKQGNQSQQDGQQQDKNNTNTDPTQEVQQSIGEKHQQEQQQKPGSQQDAKKSEQQQPQDSGGGIKFNQPKPEQHGEKQQQPQGTSGEQQKADPNKSPDSRTQGTDPNRPGGQDGPGQDPQKQGQEPQPTPQQPGSDNKGSGSMIGGKPGERFLKPGEQPGGFLTKDARFVKVRIPFGSSPEGEGENLIQNDNRAQPKTPYSNAPLKEAPPEHAQLKQQVPLEYRTILK